MSATWRLAAQRPQFSGKRELTRQFGIVLLLPKSGHSLSRKCRARSNWLNVEIDVFNDLPARAICEYGLCPCAHPRQRHIVRRRRTNNNSAGLAVHRGRRGPQRLGAHCRHNPGAGCDALLTLPASRLHCCLREAHLCAQRPLTANLSTSDDACSLPISAEAVRIRDFRNPRQRP
jgi:hypothetical protein